MNINYDRYSGLDALKVLAMFFVLTLHVLNASNVLVVNVNDGNQNYWIGTFIDYIAYCAVDCFALITGFCGINLNFKISRIIKIWMQVAFYTITISVAYILISGDVTIYIVFKSLFPVLMDNYRYFTQYFVCFFFTPFFNIVINKISSKEQKYLFALLIIFFSFYALINIGSNTGGYHVLWLCILYIIGGCIRKADILGNFSKKTYFYIYIICVSIMFTSHYVLEMFPNRVFSIITGDNVLFLTSYTSPTVVFAAISLVILFAKVELKGKLKIVVSDYLMKTNFGVFIIHSHYLMWGKVIGSIISSNSEWFMNTSNMNLILAILVIDIILYVICTMIDMCRIKIFEYLHINVICEKIGNYMTNKVSLLFKG